MASQPTSNHPSVQLLLERYPVERLPLTAAQFARADEVEQLKGADPSILFPGAPHPHAALSGLYLLLGAWDESHRVSQDINSSEGSYWHAIAHRLEPDSFNAGYWFRRVGQHAIFPELHRRAAVLLQNFEARRIPSTWDPFCFIEWCDETRRDTKMPSEPAPFTSLVEAIQRAEWELLFRWCAGSSRAASNPPKNS